MNVSAVSAPVRTAPPAAAPKDADGDHDGTVARAAAKPAAAAVVQNGKVDTYA